MVLGSPLIGHVIIVIAIFLNMCLQQWCSNHTSSITTPNNSFSTQIASRRRAVWFGNQPPTSTNLDSWNNHKHNSYIHVKCCNNASLRFYGGPYWYFMRYSKF